MQRPRSPGGVIAIAVILIAVWYVLSGMFDLLHFGTGVVSAVLIALAYRAVPDTTRVNVGRLFVYVPWLIWQVFLSNLRVARVVLSPRMSIRPTFISQPPGVVGDRALTVLGMSTTLTPGTLTVDIRRDEIFVHALDAQSAADMREGEFAAQVNLLFEERAP